MPISRKPLLLLGAALALASPCVGGVARYYYDANGRLLGEMETHFLNRAAKTDNADNPTYLHVFGTNPATAVDTLSQYGVLIAEQGLTSGDGRFTLNVQDDGNLVVYQGSTVLWASATSGHLPGYLALGGDGNLVLNGPDDTVLWASNTASGSNGNSHLVMQNDGNLVLTSGSGTVTWASNTGGH